ncbi:MAG: PD-(D/E)XK nuclease family protein [Erysipelotrichaceae bacterium]|nr:PD-(D/E)XK nuclease family protein [Erysipelotrichaceae bacterium]
MKTKIMTIIAEPIKRLDIFKQLLSHKDGLIDVEVLPLNIWLNKQTEHQNDTTLDLINCYSTITDQANHFPILKKAIAFVSFTQEILSFIYNMKEYDISLDQLPSDTLLNKEIKAIITLFLTLIPNYLSNSEKIKQLTTLDDVWLYPTYHADIASRKQFEQLYALNALPYHIPEIANQQLSLFYGLNKRKECEGLAQYLITNNINLSDTIIALANPEEYQPWIKSVLERYHIPYDLQLDKDVLIMVQRYLKLLELIISPDQAKLLDCISNHCFNGYFKEFVDLIKLKNLPFDACLTPLSAITDIKAMFLTSEIDNLNHLITKAQPQQAELLPVLSKINSCENNAQSQAELAYQLLLDLELSEQEKTEVYLIKDFLNSYLNKINNIALLTYLLKNIRSKKSDTNNNELLITTLDQVVGLKRKYLFLLGADSSAFPKLNYHNGVIDEAYYEKLLYPKKDERYRFTINEIKKCFNYCDHLFISYAYGDFAGKTKKISFELEQMIKDYPKTDFKEWPLIENDKLDYIVHTLNTKLSQSIFFKNNTLYGSISSFERYFNCPYQYFIQYGLKVNDFQEGISAASVGNILHGIMHYLVSNYHDDYDKLDDIVIKSIIEQAFSDLTLLYPYDQNLITVLKRNFFALFIRCYKDMQRLNKDDTFRPLTSEHDFIQEIKLDDINISLKGIIDRIDVTSDTYRIIDYKSSEHKLNETKFKNGQQLQLLTYLWLMQEQLQKQPEGAYYYRFDNSKTDVLPLKFSKQSHTLTEYDQDNWFEEYQKKHQYDGWHFIKKTEPDKNVKDLTWLDEQLSTLYRQLAQELSHGNIAPKPIKDACKYCLYLGICQYYAKDKIIEEEEGDDNDVEY